MKSVILVFLVFVFGSFLISCNVELGAIMIVNKTQHEIAYKFSFDDEVEKWDPINYVNPNSVNLVTEYKRDRIKDPLVSFVKRAELSYGSCRILLVLADLKSVSEVREGLVRFVITPDWLRANDCQ